MKFDTLTKTRAAQKQVHYINNAQSLHERDIVQAIAQKNNNTQTEYETDGDELIEYSLRKGFFTRWIVLNVKSNKVILSSI